MEAKHEPSELSVSISSLDVLRLGDVIASDGSTAFFTAEIRHHQQGILYTFFCTFIYTVRATVVWFLEILFSLPGVLAQWTVCFLALMS